MSSLGTPGCLFNNHPGILKFPFQCISRVNARHLSLGILKNLAFGGK